jgi:CheY-like chemotaxis protein
LNGERGGRSGHLIHSDCRRWQNLVALPVRHGSGGTAGLIALEIRTFGPNGEIFVPHDSGGAEPPKQEPKQDSKQDLQPRAAMPRILVVDDDPMVCMAIEIHLERHSFQVTIADGGEAGLRALEGTHFDLMIVDIFMPHMRGFESIRIFHERAPSVPLIAMSGYAFANLDTPAPDFLRMALELGATRCLRKPFTPVALLTVINECLADVRSSFATTAESR